MTRTNFTDKVIVYTISCGVWHEIISANCMKFQGLVNCQIPRRFGVDAKCQFITKVWHFDSRYTNNDVSIPNVLCITLFYHGC